MNRDNLLKLATYLLSGKLRAEFHMGKFTGYEVNASEYDTCGTVGCAAGHGPYAGIPKARLESWLDYSHRVFISTGNLQLWDWCFGYGWRYKDNTPEGAGKRILHLLRNGLPADHEEQRWDDDIALSYLNETL